MEELYNELKNIQAVVEDDGISKANKSVILLRMWELFKKKEYATGSSFLKLIKGNENETQYEKLYNELYNQNYYVLDVSPKFISPDINKVLKAEEKLRYILILNKEYEGLKYGISKEEATTILEWVTYNAKSNLAQIHDIKNDNLYRSCGLSNSIISYPLEHMGLDVKRTTVCNFITDENWGFKALHCPKMNSANHCFLTVSLPVQKDGGVEEVDYLIDCTYRQFFLVSKCNEGAFYNTKEHLKGKAAPQAGYFMNLNHEDREFATNLLYNGYVELNEYTAKKYGDGFVLANTGLDHYNNIINPNKFKTGISGEEYIRRFKSHLIEHDGSLKRVRLRFGDVEMSFKTPYEQANEQSSIKK